MIFVSYSHNDLGMCNQFTNMVMPLARYGGVRIWMDSEIPPGRDWKKEIGKALDRTSVAVLLVRSDFLASQFIQKVELPFFLEAANACNVEFLWVLVSDCLWKRTPLDPIQAAYPVKVPIDHLSAAKQKTAWRMVAEKVDEAWQRYERPQINKELSG